MIKIFKVVLYILFAIYLFVALLPKENLYYKILQEVEKYGIEVDTKKLQDDYLSFTVFDSIVYYQGLEICEVSKVKTSTTLYDTKIYIPSIIFSGMIKEFIPNTLRQLTITYSIKDIYKIKLQGYLGKVVIDGIVDLQKHILQIELIVPAKLKHKYKTLRKFMKPTSKGYRYEYKF